MTIQERLRVAWHVVLFGFDSEVRAALRAFDEAEQARVKLLRQHPAPAPEGVRIASLPALFGRGVALLDHWKATGTGPATHHGKQILGDYYVLTVAPRCSTEKPGVWFHLALKQERPSKDLESLGIRYFENPPPLEDADIQAALAEVGRYGEVNDWWNQNTPTPWISITAWLTARQAPGRANLQP